MPATTPSGWRIEYTSTPVAGLLGEAALEQLRDAAGELDVLQAAGDLAGGVGEHLAVLGGDDRGQLVGAVVQQLAEGEQHRRRGATARPSRHARRPPPARARPRRRPRRREARSTSPVCSPVAGLNTGAGAARGAGDRRRRRSSARSVGSCARGYVPDSGCDNSSVCYVTKHVTTCWATASPPDRPQRQGWPRAVSRAVRDGALPPATRLPPIRPVAARPGLSPTTVSAAWAAARPRRHDPHRRPARHDRRRDRGHRPRPLPPRPGRGRPASPSTCPPACPTAALLPDLQRCAATQLPTAGTPGSYLDEPVLPELCGAAARRLAVRRRATHRRRRRDGRARPGRRGRCCASATGSWSSTRASRRCSTCWSRSARAGRRGRHRRRGPGAGRARGGARRRAPAAVFLQPRAQNPTGVSLTAGAGRRPRRGAAPAPASPVVEDDSAGAISTAPGAQPRRAGCPEQTVHVRSFSKSHGPDLRLAALSGPAALLDPMRSSGASSGQGWTSRLLQRLLLDLLTDERSPRPGGRVAAALRRAHRRGWPPPSTGTGSTSRARRPQHLGAGRRRDGGGVRLASARRRAASGTPFDLGARRSGHIRVTTAAIDDGYDDLADLVVGAARAGTWSGQR